MHYPACELAISIPTDTPFLPGDLVARLQEARTGAGADIVVATSGGSTHPVVALWPIAIRQDMRHALIEENIHKMGAFIDRHKVAAADWPIEPYDPFFNANEPQDIAQAEKILAGLR